MVTIEIRLDDERVERFGVILGVFIAVGLGLGATAFISMVAFADGTAGSFFSGILGLFALLLVFFLGPAVAGAVAFVATRREESSAWATVTGAFGSMIGFYLMVVLVIALVAAGSAVIAAQDTSQQQTGERGSGNDLDYSYYETPAPSGGGGSGLGIDFAELVTPTLVAGIPTAISGGLAGYVGPVLRR